MQALLAIGAAVAATITLLAASAGSAKPTNSAPHNAALTSSVPKAIYGGASAVAYSRATTASQDRSNWLDNVDGHTPIWQLSIPGTHDSYTGCRNVRPQCNILFGPGTAFQTQTLPVPQQLKMGIRGLDLRLDACSFKPSACPNDKNDFYVQHGGQSTQITLSGVLAELRTFLSAHRSEFIILRAQVQRAGGDFATKMNNILGEYRDILWRGKANAGFVDPPLTDVRGKVVLLKQFPDAAINDYGMKGPKADHFVTQDLYALKRAPDLETKWSEVVSNWSRAVGESPEPNCATRRACAYVNFLSASITATSLSLLPFFVASGRSSVTGPLRATGRVVRTSNLRDSRSGPYPDFHRVACFLGLCTVAYTGINLLMYDVLSDMNRAGQNHAKLRKRLGMGLIYMDFPGQPLVNDIIARNVYCPAGRAADASHNRLTSKASVATPTSPARVRSHSPFIKSCPSAHRPPPRFTG